LPFWTSMPNHIFTHALLTCILISFIVTTSVLILLIILWCWSLAKLNLVDPFNEAAPRRMKLDRLC
jgi:hypothetical protein